MESKAAVTLLDPWSGTRACASHLNELLMHAGLVPPERAGCEPTGSACYWPTPRRKPIGAPIKFSTSCC